MVSHDGATLQWILGTGEVAVQRLFEFTLLLTASRSHRFLSASHPALVLSVWQRQWMSCLILESLMS